MVNASNEIYPTDETTRNSHSSPQQQSSCLLQHQIQFHSMSKFLHMPVWALIFQLERQNLHCADGQCICTVHVCSVLYCTCLHCTRWTVGDSRWVIQIWSQTQSLIDSPGNPGEMNQENEQKGKTHSTASQDVSRVHEVRECTLSNCAFCQ